MDKKTRAELFPVLGAVEALHDEGVDADPVTMLSLVADRLGLASPLEAQEALKAELVLATLRPRIEKVGRNSPCPCRSGLKYKKCCGRFNQGAWRGHLITHSSDEPSVGEQPGKMIVKVQFALTEGDEPDMGEPAMMYDRERTFERLVPPDQVELKMRGRPKAFFYATFQFGQLVLEDEAPWQPW